MADNSSTPDTFSTIAEGYGGAQQTLARLGLLPGAMPGSFSPADRNGTALQFPTPPPPRFPIVASTTLPFPSAAPSFFGAASPMPPSVLPPMFSTPQPTFTQGMPSANYAAQQQMPTMGGMPPRAEPYPHGMAIAAPNWTRAFTQPMQGFGIPSARFGEGTLISDAMTSGYLPSNQFFSPAAPGVGVNHAQHRARAGLRMNARIEDWGTSALGIAGTAVGAIGGAAAIGIGGATLGGFAAAAGVLTLPIAAAGAAISAYQDERAGTRAVQDTFSGMSMGPLANAMGQGINPMAARQIQNKFKGAASEVMGTSGDMFSTMAMAQEAGLMRGHTNSVDQVVTRIKDLAKIAKGIVDLGEGITQQDAVDLQALASNMGIGSAQFAGQGLGKRLVTAARLTGQSASDVMSGVGAAGASMFAQSGMNAGSGMLVGLHTAGLSAAMVNSGTMSSRSIATLGGESGIQNTMAQGITRFQALNARNMALGLLTGPDASHYMETGTLSMKEASDRGGRVFKDKNLTKKERQIAEQLFVEAAPGMLSEMQENMAPERMQQMQIAQALAYQKESKGTMTAFTAFTKATGSEEGARVLMNVMENPGILRAQSAQAALVRKQELSASAASYNSSNTWYAKTGKEVGLAYDDTMRWLGVGAAADWAAGRDYEQEAEAAGVDPRGAGPRYDNLISTKDAVASLTSGPNTLGKENLDKLFGAQGEGTPKKKYSRSGNNDFAIDALEEVGLDAGESKEEAGRRIRAGMRLSGVSGRWERPPGYTVADMTEKSNKRIDELMGTTTTAIDIMHQYDGYRKTPRDARTFLNNLNSDTDTTGIGKLSTSVAAQITKEVINAPKNVGKTLANDRVAKIIKEYAKAQNIKITADNFPGIYDQTERAIAANLQVSSSDGGPNASAIEAAASGVRALESIASGALSPEDIVEDISLDDNEYMRQLRDSGRTFFGFDEDDDKNTKKRLAGFANLAKGAGLEEAEDIQTLLESKGMHTNLQAIASDPANSKRKRDVATRLLDMKDSERNPLLAATKAFAKGAPQGEGANKAVAGSISNIIAKGKGAAEQAALTQLLEDTGIKQGTDKDGAAAIERIRNIIKADPKGVSGRDLSIQVLGEAGGRLVSSDKNVQEHFTALNVARQRGLAPEEIEKRLQKALAAVLEAKQREAAAGEGGRGSGDPGTDATENILQEMSLLNKQAFAALSELTTKSAVTVDAMTKFIAAVSAHLPLYSGH